MFYMDVFFTEGVFMIDSFDKYNFDSHNRGQQYNHATCSKNVLIPVPKQKHARLEFVRNRKFGIRNHGNNRVFFR